jgi:phosphoribosylglycinamide formyltransferase-1
VSGSGTNLQALLDATGAPGFGAQVAVVLSDRADAYGLTRAGTAGVATEIVELPAGAGASAAAQASARSRWDAEVARRLRSYQPDLVVSAGFMRLLGPEVLESFPYRIVNTHPALLPSFPGTRAVRDALEYGVRVTGATVHLVDAGVDTGPVLDQVAVRVEPSDDEATLHERIKIEERRLLVEVVGQLVRNGYEVKGRRVTVL